MFLFSLEWLQAIAYLGLSASRFYGAWAMLPVLGRHTVGGSFLKNCLLLMFAFPVLFIPWPYQDTAMQANVMQWSMWLFQELTLGFMIGFSITVPFWALDGACYILDTLRGASMASVLNPLLGEQSSVLGLFFSYLLTTLFFCSGGFHEVLSLVYDSYELIPMAAPFAVNASWLKFACLEWQTMMELTFSFAIPAILTMLIIDISLGLINRSAKQLNVFIFSLPLKSMMTFILLALGLTFSLSRYLERMLSVTTIILNFLQGLM